jgi:2-amino-4-hydroxy-6-hydroxymethyldihydropteridine diphosphokinase
VTRFAIGLGSNLGDRIDHLRSAVDVLGQLGDVGPVSSLYESAPVGGPEQDPFLNAVALLESELKPHALLERLLEIEAGEGRVRKVRWGPRTLDLDILSSDGDPVTDESLQIPHPRAHEREFVLRPLIEVWPDAELGPGIDVSRALADVGDQGVDRLVKTWVGQGVSWLGRMFVGVQFAWFIAVALAMASDGTLPDGSVDVFRLVGAVVAVVGGALAFVSSRRLGPALTALPEPRTDAPLVESGPYSLARHPIYGGVTLFILGASMIVDSLTGALLSMGLLPFFYLKSEYEERRLRIQYAGYRSYRERVTRRLIPFLI